MDAERFDTFTQSLVAASSRRRVLGGLLRAVSAGVPLALTHEATDAKKKRRRKRKRKRKPSEGCPAGQVSCDGQCRLPAGAPCGSHDDCCSRYCPFQECYPSCRGKICVPDADCCPEENACPATQPHTCGGCAGPGRACGGAFPCCYSECNDGQCLSTVGERCVSRHDCDGGACVAGKCTCPDECCADADCFPAEQCLNGKCQPRPPG
jgi:hypothetical protein